jgi:hypothetical protein
MLDTKEKTIPIQGILDLAILCRFNNSKHECAFIKGITKEEEKDIDDNQVYTFKNKDKEYLIPIDNIYMYGEININNEDDIKMIKKCNLVGDSIDSPSFMMSNFDYELGQFITIENIPKHAPCSDAFAWFKYRHCMINKPNRIVVCRIPRSYLGKVCGLK